MGGISGSSQDKERTLKERGSKSGHGMLGRKRNTLEDEVDLLAVEH